MPGIDELAWKEYVDFTGGLWERGNDRECAANGLLECMDCFPQQHGGLKAFARFEPVGAPFEQALTSSTRCYGVWDFPNALGARGLAALVFDYPNNTLKLVSLFSTDFNQHIQFPSDQQVRGYKAQLKTIYSRTDVSLLRGAVRAEIYPQAPPPSSLTYMAYFSFPINSVTPGTTNGPGLYRSILSSTNATNFAAGITTVHTAGPSGVWTHQGRLMTLGSDQVTGWEGIFYTNPGDSVFSTARLLKPAGLNPYDLAFLAGFEPSELITMKRNHSLMSIQGSITTPTVRETSYTHLTSVMYPVRSDIGLVIVTREEGAFAWTGQALTHISPQIVGSPMAGPAGRRIRVSEFDASNPAGFTENNGSVDGWSDIDISSDVTDLIGTGQAMGGQLGALGPFIGFAAGYMLDTRTAAWFKQSTCPTARYWAVNEDSRRVFVATSTAVRTDPNVIYWARFDESNWVPMDEYSFTLPLILTPAQMVNVRELEYHLNAVNDTSDVRVEVTFQTNNGGTETLSLGPFSTAKGPSAIRVQVPGHPSAWYKIRTVVRSNRKGDAAPTLERMFCGTQAGTRLPAA